MFDGLKNDPGSGNTDQVDLIGLDSFIKSLEKHFFSKATVRTHPIEPKHTDLVVELECNFKLSEAICHFDREIFFETVERRVHLARAWNILQKQNVAQIDIEEFTLHMLDTTIVVHRIYERSVPEQWNNILEKIVEHYASLTSKLYRNSL